ncbi:DUF6107 family protein [Aureimonas populi]|uniref:DUF6107 family protein n=1 Tax=Aureimonas populi TaxID=1701758 RepID=A0ABW5CIB2_9HYPH|nr:DUF6107 family protein [Aureimonas populi]
MTADPISPLALLSAKLFGAVAGSAISVAYLLPSGRREAAIRFLAGAVMGLVFGGPAGLMLAEHFGFASRLSASELALMGSAAASLCAWGALGVLTRFIDGLFQPAGAKR